MDPDQPQLVEGSSLPIAAGTVIAGRYRLEKLVGQGAMGTVWRAEHLRLGSAVAVKLMGDQLAQVPNAAERFLREAKAAARLASEYVVRVFDFGVHGKTPFLVMELLQGESLRDRLDKVGRLPFDQVATIVTHCCRAVQRAHAAGVIHRDLKPENLFLVEEGQLVVKVLDFGIAKVSGEWAGPQQSHTQTGAVIGTPYYMSPEQVRGRAVLDHRADLWSIAVIAREALCGQLPFEGETFGDLVLKICTEKAPGAQLGPAGFDAWLAKGLAKRPAERFESAEAMGAALAQLSSVAAVQQARPQAPLPLAPACGQEAVSRPALVAPSPASFAAVSVGTARNPSSGRAPLWLGAALALGLFAVVVWQLRGGSPTASPAHLATAGVSESPGDKPPASPPVSAPAPAAGSLPEPPDPGRDIPEPATQGAPKSRPPEESTPGETSAADAQERLHSPTRSTNAAPDAPRTKRSQHKRRRRRPIRRKKISRPAVVTTDLFSEPD